MAKERRCNICMRFDDNDIFYLSEEDLVAAFSDAYVRTRERDSALFEESRPQERAFMFRFALELRNCFAEVETHLSRHDGKPVISLDVEYNRDGCSLKAEDPENPGTHKWIAPDIILHERLSGEFNGDAKNRNNIFACEMKKNALSDGEDSERVKSFLAKRRYQFGVDFFRFATADAAFDLYYYGEKKRTYCFQKETKKFIQVKS